MSVVSNDPSWWPTINLNRRGSYFVVASSAGVMYDWALTFGQEVELVWRQRWSLMTVMYLGVRYIGILSAVLSILTKVLTISMTDEGCSIITITRHWINVVVVAMIGIIMIARLYAMYQGSRKMLIFLVVVFMAVRIVTLVMTATSMVHISEEVLVLSGTYQCIVTFEEEDVLMASMTSMLTTAWEVLILCLAVWIAIKHFRDMQRPSKGWIFGDLFTALLKSHVVYFASYVVVSCIHLIYLSPMLLEGLDSPGNRVAVGVLEIFMFIQMFVLGPRLILGVRQYNAKLVAESDAGLTMASVAFREYLHVSASSSVV